MSRRVQLLGLGILLLVAIGFRLWRLDHIPPGFHFDESFEGLEAWRIWQEPDYRPLFLTGNFGVLPFNSYANALTFALFQRVGAPVGPVAMRATTAAFGVLGVLAVYLLAGELRRQVENANRPTPLFPLFAAATLAVMRWHVHFSRMGIEPILVPLLWAASTWLLLRGWRTGGWVSFAGSGALLGIAMYAYQGAWIMPPLALVTALLLLLADWKWSEPKLVMSLGHSSKLIGLLITAGVASVVVAPLALYFWQQPEQFLLRPAQIAVGTEGQPGGSAWAMAWATFQMFVPFGGGDQDPRRNLPGEPALTPWLLVPFYIGLLSTLPRLLRLPYIIIWIGLIGLVLPGIFSEYAPHYHRILGAAAPTALLCGLGFDWLWQGSNRLGRLRPVLRGGVLSLLLVGAIVSARDYFVRWATLPDLFYAFDVGLWQIGQRMAELPGEETLYLTPRDANHPTIAFALTTQVKGAPQPVSFDGRSLFPVAADLTAVPERYLVISHEDFRTPLLLPEVLPAAHIAEAWQDWQGQPYAQLYERPPQTAPQRPPQNRLTATLGDGIRIAGFDVQPAALKAGEILYLQLHWQVDAPPTTDWTVFTHVITQSADGMPSVIAGKDSRPGNGSLPTMRWRAGWRILDEYQIALPADLPPGTYGLQIGLYEPGGRHLPAESERLSLGEVTLE
jgi:hypothetical protein